MQQLLTVTDGRLWQWQTSCR